MKKWLMGSVVWMLLAGPALALDVVATSPSMGALVRAVAPGAELTVLAGPDQDLHALQAKPSMMRALRGADLLVAVGAELEVGWLPAASAGAANPAILPGTEGYFEAAAQVPLLDVAEVEQNVAFASISRRDGRRVISVSMDVEPKRAITQVLTALRQEELPQLRADFPGITWSFEGSDAEMRQATASLWGSFGLALAVIYSLLAVAFRNYVQPLIVLVAIPFGIVGAIFGHMLLGFDLSLVSLMGVIALSGVVINDSLIMVDYANRHRAETSAFDAIVQAGLRRFRPILLTTVTTFGGLVPLIFETSLQAQYIIPMAISLGFGILFATAIILVLVPCLYLIFEDVKALFA